MMVELEEDGVRIALTIVDTPGFGDNIDNDSAYVFAILGSPLRSETLIDSSVSKKSLAILSANMTIFLLKNLALGVKRASATTEFTPYYTSSHLQDMRT